MHKYVKHEQSLELHKAAESVSKSEAGSCFLKQEALSLYLEGRGISLRSTYEVILGHAEQSTSEEHRVPSERGTE